MVMFGFYFHVKGQRSFKSLRINEGKRSTKPIELGIVCLLSCDNLCRGGWFHVANYFKVEDNLSSAQL